MSDSQDGAIKNKKKNKKKKTKETNQFFSFYLYLYNKRSLWRVTHYIKIQLLRHFFWLVPLAKYNPGERVFLLTLFCFFVLLSFSLVCLSLG